MYKRAVGNTLFLFFFVVSTNVFSQNCGDLAGSISSSDVNLRITQFARKATFVSKKNISSMALLLSVTDLTKMLQDFYDMDISNKYDGVRIYFIVADKEIGDSSRISLLFIPTMPTTEPEECNARNRSQDDNINAYYLTKAGLKKIDLTTSSSESFMVLKYRLAYGDIAAKTPSGVGVAFQETQSLWYSKEVFFKQGVLNDMLSYLKQCKSITGLKVLFASFPVISVPSDCERFQYKTHPIFQIVGTNLKTSYYTFAATEIVKNNKKKGRHLILGDTYSDTGLPCPPNKCN